MSAREKEKRAERIREKHYEWRESCWFDEERDSRERTRERERKREEKHT